MSSDCSSIPDAKFFNEKYTYPEWFTRKKMIFHNKMLKRLKKLRYLHSRSSQHYESMNIKFSAPSIVITALSGIASFLSTSQYVDSDAQNACGITVGVLASIASVFQAFSAACQYGAKKEAHRTVAEQYNALIVKTKFEMEMPNEEDFIDKLEQAILEIDAKCNYFVPQFIIKEWEQKERAILFDSPKKNKISYDTTDNLNVGIYMDNNDNEDNNNSKENIKNLNNKYGDRDHVSIKIIEDTSIENVNEFNQQEKAKETTYLLNKNDTIKTTNSINLIDNDMNTIGLDDIENNQHINELDANHTNI